MRFGKGCVNNGVRGIASAVRAVGVVAPWRLQMPVRSELIEISHMFLFFGMARAEEVLLRRFGPPVGVVAIKA